MNRPIPFGGLGGFPPVDGIAAYGGFRTPGPTRVAFNELSESTSAPENEATESSSGDILTVDFRVGAERYRLRRTDARQLDARWLLSSRAFVVDPNEAVAIIERAIEQHRDNVTLVRALERAGSLLAGLHTDGTFVLIWFRPLEERIVPAPAPPPARSRSSAAASPPPAAAEAPMGPMQAAVLKDAAVSGVPFCEECARRAAAAAAHSSG
jgi:hypothetical protein